MNGKDSNAAEDFTVNINLSTGKENFKFKFEKGLSGEGSEEFKRNDSSETMIPPQSKLSANNNNSSASRSTNTTSTNPFNFSKKSTMTSGVKTTNVKSIIPKDKSKFKVGAEDQKFLSKFVNYENDEDDNEVVEIRKEEEIHMKKSTFITKVKSNLKDAVTDEKSNYDKSNFGQEEKWQLLNGKLEE